MRQSMGQFLLFVVFVYLCSIPVRSVQADTLSGHHYSWLEGAAIGHDFGRNPWSRYGTEGFAGGRGRANLREALARAVAAGETAMSFDFAFDLRSVVAFHVLNHPTFPQKELLLLLTPIAVAQAG